MAIGLTNGATVYVDSEYSASYVKGYAVDDSYNTFWGSTNTDYPHWFALDLGAGITKAATRCLIAPYSYDGTAIKDFKIQGSLDSSNGADGTWDDIYVGQVTNDVNLQRFEWSNTVGYRWYRIYVTSAWRTSKSICFYMFELFDDDLYPLIPFMTANNAPSPYAISANFSVTTGYDLYKAFDKPYHKYQDCLASANGVTSGIVTIDLGEDNAKIVTAYAIMPQVSFGSSKAPKTWTFEGSNDNTSWNTLDTRSNITVWTDFERKDFSVSNTTAYRYYRLNCTANNGDSRYYAIGMMQIFGRDTSSPPASTGILFATFI